MKSIRAIVLLIAAMVPAAVVFAQNSGTPLVIEQEQNRVYHSLSTAKNAPTSLSFSVSIDTTPLQANSESDYPFEGTMKNTSPDSLRIQFDRTQFIPPGWTSSVCFGQNCFASSVSEQSDIFAPGETRSLIVHQYPALNDVPDTGTIYLRLSAPSGGSLDTSVLKLTTYFTPPDPPLIFKFADGTNYQQSFVGNGLHLLSPVLENHSGYRVMYAFSMQAQLPPDWTIKMCAGDSCTSGTNVHSLFNQIGDPDGNDQRTIAFKITAANVTQVDSAVIILNVHPQTTNPADSASYRFVAIVKPSSGVSPSGDDRAGLAVINAWPNPLHNNAKLNLDVVTDRSGAAFAHIYSIDGTETIVTELGELSEGSNRVQLGDLNLPSGNYIIRIQQETWTSEPVRVNYLR